MVSANSAVSLCASIVFLSLTFQERWLSVACAHEVQLSKVAWEGWRAHPGRRAMQAALGLGLGGWVQAAREASADAGRKVKTMRVRPKRHPHPQAGEAARSESSDELFKKFG